MLSAKPNAPRALELVRLALIMVSRHQSNVPADLKRHFNTVISEARMLRDQPSQLTAPPQPESIELAFLLTAGELNDEIDIIGDLDAVTPDVAYKLLAGINRESICIDELVPSAR